MCIIVIKPAGVRLPDDNILKTCWDNNPDGAGLMYAANKKVYIKKGFMKWKSFNKALKQLKKIDTYNIPIVLHFRITTHGGTSAGNTHPFPISNNIKELQALEYTTALGIAHNGIIDIPAAKNSSDTMEYIRHELWYLYQLKNNFYKNKDALTLISNRIDSRMVFMDANGCWEKVGKFIEEKGIFYSNASYTERYYFPACWDWEVPYSPNAPRVKGLQWLTEGYVKDSKGGLLEPWDYLIDSENQVYLYDYVTDTATNMPGHVAFNAADAWYQYNPESKNIEILDII